MVCNRCIKVVSDELIKEHIDFIKVDFGKVYFDTEITQSIKNKIDTILKKQGFEVLEDKNTQLISQIKSLLIEEMYHEKGNEKMNTSLLISTTLGMDYFLISKLFSEVEGITIEKYIILQKIEKVKELLKYGELNLSQISYKLDYSSPQHLSRQFKQVTGLTPTQFKDIGQRKSLDTI